jgi:hypothetical protein
MRFAFLGFDCFYWFFCAVNHVFETCFATDRYFSAVFSLF